MQGGVLSHFEGSTSIPLLLNACHCIDRVHPRDCEIDLNGKRPPSAILTDIIPDFVNTRMGSSAPDYGLAIAPALERSSMIRLNDVAELAAERLGLAMAPVDLLDSEGEGPLPIELRSSGLPGVSTTTGRDVAGDVVGLLEGRVRALAPGGA